MNRVFWRGVVLALSAAALAMGPQTAIAEIIMQHQGQADPASTEGWAYTWNSGGGDPLSGYSPVSLM